MKEDRPVEYPHRAARPAQGRGDPPVRGAQRSPLKVELIREKGDATVTVYRQGEFVDFCLGPHVPSTGLLKHFKLLSVSGAYWKGDEHGQLQRIYGTGLRRPGRNSTTTCGCSKRPRSATTAVSARSSTSSAPARSLAPG